MGKTKLTIASVILLQMFIAVINENFEVAEETKKREQASSYWAMHKSEEARPSWMRNLNPYQWLKANPVTVKVDNLPSNLVLPMQKSLVQDYNRVPEPEQSNSVCVPGYFFRRAVLLTARALLDIERDFQATALFLQVNNGSSPIIRWGDALERYSIEESAPCSGGDASWGINAGRR
jgi:hypothetical protein